MCKIVAVAVAVAAVAVAGCSALQNAGVSEYSVRPFKIGEETVCCDAVIKSGREISSLKAHVKHSGANYEIDISVEGIKAFEGQAIAKDSAGAAIPIIGGLVK